MSTVEQSLSWPESMLGHIQSEAARTDRSMSWCVQKAWRLAGEQLRALAPGAEHAEAANICRARFSQGPQLQTTVFLPADMAKEIETEARRQGRSPSWLMQQAWCLAAASIADWPTTGE